MTIIQMARIRMAITPRQAISLINSLIDGTSVQEQLIEFKKIYKIKGNDVLGRVGAGYRRGFKKRNAHLLVSKKGQKFELDRSQWSTYHNFKQMYACIAEEMETAGVAKKN